MLDIIGAASTCAIGGLALGYVCGALHRNAAIGFALAKSERQRDTIAAQAHQVGELECEIGKLLRENSELIDARARSDTAIAREAAKRRADEKLERKAATYAALGPVANWPVREDVVAPVKAKRAGVK